jgi:hypothetical protein
MDDAERRAIAEAEAAELAGDTELVSEPVAGWDSAAN